MRDDDEKRPPLPQLGSTPSAPPEKPDLKRRILESKQRILSGIGGKYTGEETSRWLTHLEENPTSAEEPIADGGLVDNSMLSMPALMDLLFDHLERYSFELNKVSNDPDMRISVERPSSWHEKVEYMKKTRFMRGHLATRLWTFFVWAEELEADGYFIPTEFLVGFQPSDDYVPYIKIKRHPTRSEDIVWAIDGKVLPSHEIPKLARRLITQMVRIANGEAAPDEKFHHSTTENVVEEEVVVDRSFESFLEGQNELSHDAGPPKESRSAKLKRLMTEAAQQEEADRANAQSLARANIGVTDRPARLAARAEAAGGNGSVDTSTNLPQTAPGQTRPFAAFTAPGNAALPPAPGAMSNSPPGAAATPPAPGMPPAPGTFGASPGSMGTPPGALAGSPGSMGVPPGSMGLPTPPGATAAPPSLPTPPAAFGAPPGGAPAPSGGFQAPPNMPSFPTPPAPSQSNTNPPGVLQPPPGFLSGPPGGFGSSIPFGSAPAPGGFNSSSTTTGDNQTVSSSQIQSVSSANNQAISSQQNPAYGTSTGEHEASGAMRSPGALFGAPQERSAVNSALLPEESGMYASIPETTEAEKEPPSPWASLSLAAAKQQQPAPEGTEIKPAISDVTRKSQTNLPSLKTLEAEAAAAAQAAAAAALEPQLPHPSPFAPPPTDDEEPDFLHSEAAAETMETLQHDPFKPAVQLSSPNYDDLDFEEDIEVSSGEEPPMPPEPESVAEASPEPEYEMERPQSAEPQMEAVSGTYAPVGADIQSSPTSNESAQQADSFEETGETEQFSNASPDFETAGAQDLQAPPAPPTFETPSAPVLEAPAAPVDAPPPAPAAPRGLAGLVRKSILHDAAPPSPREENRAPAVQVDFGMENEPEPQEEPTTLPDVHGKRPTLQSLLSPTHPEPPHTPSEPTVAAAAPVPPAAPVPAAPIPPPPAPMQPPPPPPASMPVPAPAPAAALSSTNPADIARLVEDAQRHTLGNLSGMINELERAMKTLQEAGVEAMQSGNFESVQLVMENTKRLKATKDRLSELLVEISNV